MVAGSSGQRTHLRATRYGAILAQLLNYANVHSYLRSSACSNLKLAFLEAYRLNVTAYLPAELRAQLHVLGQSPAAQTPAGNFARDILNRLLIDLSWASSRLEGNTHSR